MLSALQLSIFQKQPLEVFCKRKVLLEISQNSQENTSDLPLVFSWRFLDYVFQQKSELKNGKYPDGAQVFTFLLRYQFVWRQRFQKKFDRY